MSMLVQCGGCRTQLVLPPGAQSIQCAICRHVTPIAYGRAAPALSAPQVNNPYGSGLQHPQYTPTPPNAHGQKKAVLVGINYKFSRHQLKGCINDSNCMRHLLTTKFNFPAASILTLTEDQTNPLMKPTRYNMHMAMVWLVQGCQAGDSLVFHFSGHGSQQRDYSGEELDGMNETLCPVDFETAGMITDDEINNTIVRPIPHGVRLHAIIDACHSGTVLDLPWLCKFNRYGQFTWEDHRPRSGVWKGTSGGVAYSFSGCDDHQTSADTSALSRVTSTGAMTFCFIQAIERGHAQTYGSLLCAMRDAIRTTNVNSGMGAGPVTSLLEMLVQGGSTTGGLTQEPQLTAADMFDINSPFHL
jgi:LSD1 subclass zinc finger protein